MDIKPVNNEQFYYDKKIIEKRHEDVKIAGNDDQQNKRSDKLEISSEANKLQPIQSKLASNVYNRPEILKDVAQRLSKLYPPEKKA
jgi:hypothetical protein